MRKTALLIGLGLLLSITPVWAEPVIVHPDFDTAPSISRDGRLLAFVSNRSGNREIWLQDLSAGENGLPRQLTDHPATKESPALNPEGTRLLYVSHESDPLGDIILMDLASNQTQRLTDHRHGETAPAWSPDGAHILYTRLATSSEPQAVIRRNLATSQESVLLTGAASCAQGPDDWLICSRAGQLVALQTGKPEVITPLTQGLDREPTFGTSDRLFYSHFANDDDNRATLWSARFVPGSGLVERYQLTPEQSASQHPAFAMDHLYYGNILDGDIHRINLPEFFQFYVDPVQAQITAATHFANGQTNPGLLILGNLSANPERIPAQKRLHFDLEYVQNLIEAEAFPQARTLLARYAQTPGEAGALAAIHALTLPIHAAVNQVSAHELGRLVKKGHDGLLDIGKRWHKSEQVTGLAHIEASRLFLLIGDTLSALEQLAPLDHFKHQELRIQALFARGQIYRQLNDEAGLKRVFIQVIRAMGEENRWGIRAIAQAIAVTEQNRSFPQNITALRDLLKEYPDLKHLGVAILSRIARIYQESGEEQKTIATLEEIPARYPDLIPAQRASLWWKAEQLTRQESFAKAAQAYEAILKLPGTSDDELERARDLMTQQQVEAALKQRDLGDPKLAAKALSQILADHPDSVEAHRAYIATKAMLGKVDETLSHYAVLAKQQPDNPTLQYAHALALTYVDKPDFKHIIDRLTRVTEQVPNVSYFHQTLAWAHEQFETVNKAEHGHLEIAVQEYLTALRLTNRGAHPKMHANLLLNLGNVSFAMKNYSGAYSYFSRWSKLNRPLGTPLENALLLRKLAESAFKTDHTQEAVTLYRKVLDLLPADKKGLRLELLERLALAHQTLGEHAQAASGFSQALEGNLALNQTENLALLQRNIGINLYQAALPPIGAQTPPPIDRAALQSALASYLQSLNYLKEHGKKEKPQNKGFISLVLSLGENSSQAALGFDRTGEEKLLFGFVSTAYEGLEEPEPALEYLQKKLALITEPLLPDVSVMTEKAVLFNRIGLLHFRLGQRAKALEQTLASLALTEKLHLEFGNRVNLYNLSKIAVEMLLAHEPLDPTPIELLANQVQSPEWEAKSPKNAFYTLANTAFLLVHLPEIPLTPPLGTTTTPLLSGYHQLYELKSRSDSLYRRAEQILLPGKAFSSHERLANLIRIKLNRLVIATAAEKSEAAARLTAEIQQLTQSGLTGTGWILSLLQAEATQDPIQQESQLQHTLEQALAMPVPVQPQGNGRIQAPFLEQLARLYTDRLIRRGDLKKAFSINEQLAMRRVSLLLHDRLEQEFFLNGLGEEREEIADLLQDLHKAITRNDQAAQKRLTEQWQTRLTELNATHPAAVAWLQPVDPAPLPARLLSRKRPYLQWLAGQEGHHLLLLTGQEILHATLNAQGELQGEPRFQQLLAQAEVILLSAPTDAPLKPLALGQRPVARIQTLYDLLPASPRQGLFHSRIALTGALNLSTTTMASEVPLHTTPLSLESTENLAHLANAHLLIARVPVSDLAIPAGKKNQVTEKIPLEKLEVAQGHSAILTTAASLDPREAPLLAQALLHAGFAHVILLPDTLAVPMVEQLIQRYLTHLETQPALFALTQAWQESGGSAANPVSFHGQIGLSQQEMRHKAVELYNEELAAAVAFQQADDPAAALRRVENGLALIKLADHMEQFTQLTQFAVETLFKLEEYPRAIIHQERLLAFLGQQGEPLARAQALYTLGILHSRLEQFEPAITHLEAAVKIWTEQKVTDKLAEGVATLGVVKENRGAYADALVAFGNSFDLFKQQNNKQAMAEQYLRMGRIYQLRLTRYATAKEQFEKALSLFQAVGDAEGEARARLDIGLTLESMGRFAEADALYQAAIATTSPDEASLIQATGTLYLANTAWYQGEYQMAFKRLLTAQELADQIKDKPLAIMIANTRGLLYWTLNENNKALLHLQKAIDLASQENIPIEWASSLNNKGLVLRQMGQLDEALALFEQAKAIDTKLQSRWGLGYDHRNIGITRMRMGQLKEAEQAFIQAESLSEQIGNPVNQAKTLLELGHVNHKLNQLKPASEFFQRAADMAQKYGLKEVQWRAMTGQARLARQQGENQAALTAYAQAIQVVEGMRASLKIDALRNSFQVDKQDLYREIILLLVDLGQERQAFDYLERFRSRNFIDLLANNKLTLHSTQDEAALNRVNGLFQELESLARELAALKTPDPALRKQYQEKQAAAEEAQLELQQSNPELSGFVAVHPLTLAQFEPLLEPGVGVLAYLLTEKELLIWLSTASGTHFRRVAVSEKELTDTIRHYRDLMQNMEPVEAVMTRLYHWLIQPMAKEIEGLRYLGIIPHDALHFLAFAALQGPNGPLVEQQPLFYSPSASAMQYALAKRAKQKRTKVLAIGNPDLGDVNFDLPLAEFEADSIRWSFPEGDLLKGKKATKGWIVENIAKYGIIHIAAHGDFQNINPLFSALWLASGKAGQESDPEAGHLTVKEIFSLELNADLVTLSACQTGLGQLKGSEMIGLSRAFLYAGTHSLISSLWRVDDLSTAVLMKHFYRNYTTMNKADSLRQAQLLVKQNFPHPANWAGFNLMGDYQ